MKEKILILGGTEFVGRLLVEALTKDKTKELFLFNRGRTNPNLFPEVTKIIGNRETDDIKKIKAQHWDYVIDFSSYYPASLQRTIDQLTKTVKKYIYISTISVYDFGTYIRGEKITEDFAKVTCTPEEAIDTTMRTYGKKKMACEHVLAKADWLNTIIIRPSIIYGKHDPTDRFYYWCRKIKKTNEVLIPNQGENKLTLTYADDMVRILLHAINENLPAGAYNCGTHLPVSFNQMLTWMNETCEESCAFFGMDQQTLKQEKVALPISVLCDLIIDSSKIKLASGLQFQSFENSVKTMMAYFEAENWPTCKVGISDQAQKDLISKIKTKAS